MSSYITSGSLTSYQLSGNYLTNASFFQLSGNYLTTLTPLTGTYLSIINANDTYQKISAMGSYLTHLFYIIHLIIISQQVTPSLVLLLM